MSVRDFRADRLSPPKTRCPSTRNNFSAKARLSLLSLVAFHLPFSLPSSCTLSQDNHTPCWWWYLLTMSPPPPPPRKRRRVQWSEQDELINDGSPPPVVAPPGPSAITSTSTSTETSSNVEGKEKEKEYLRSEIYNPIEYGDFSSYMKHKRAKLKVQQAALLEDEQELLGSTSTATASDIFRGCCIYINGQTHPPYSELRRLIVLHGGDHMAYLDQKRPCTHIVASNLTPKKRIEFKDYKVVLPSWVLESIQLGKRADWRKWRCDAVTGTNGHVGAQIVHNDTGGAWSNAATDDAPQKGKQLPKYGETVESPWGRPSNQKTLFDTFAKPKEPPRKPATVRFSDQQQPKQHQQPVQLKEKSPPLPPVVPVNVPKKPDAPAPLPPAPVTPTKPKASTTTMATSTTTSRPPYASRPSNIHAARLLASPSWRERNTATSEGFLSGYFAKSRLHHLSTWKSSLQDMVSSALREAGRSPGSVDLPKGVRRVIMHIDFDSFFVSVGLRKRLDLRDKPVAVCHGSGSESAPADTSSTSEIASCNYVARESGVRNGMSLGQAVRLCPAIQTIPYDFTAYNDISIAFYTLLLEHADALQAVSVDEALVDVSMLLEQIRTGTHPPGSLADRYRDRQNSQGETWSAEKQLAEALRDEIRAASGCEASIGIGSNVLLARLATRRAKPGGSFHLTDQDSQAFLDELEVDDLHGIGWSLRERLREMFNTISIGAIRRATTASRLAHEFGPKKGRMLWDKMHGRDTDRIEGNKLRQSVGSHVNYGIRFLTNEEAETFVDGMCAEVSQRARAVRLRGRQVAVQVMVRAKDAPAEAPKFLGHGRCDTHHRSVPCPLSDDASTIKAKAWPLIRDLNVDPRELRGIAISLNKLEPADANAAANNTPRRRQAAQAVLNFSPVKRAPTPPGEEEEEEEEERDLPALTPGRDAATPRKPGTPPPVMPTPTQYQLPPASQLDADVVRELPTQIRVQIEARLPRSTPNTPRKPVTDTSQLLLPSASQIDLTVLAELPSSVQRDILRHVGGPPPQRSQSESPTRRPSSSQLERLGIDPDVLAHLPAEVQTEVLTSAAARFKPSVQRTATLSLAQQRRKTADPSVSARPHTRTPAPDTVFFPLDPTSQTPPPSLRSASTVPELRNLVSQWFSSFAPYGPPRDRDVQRFSKFLTSCVDPCAPVAGPTLDLEKVNAVLAWFRHVVRGNQGWELAFSRVKDAVDQVVLARFGARLSLD